MKLLVAALDSELQAFPAEIDGWDRLVTGPGKLLAAVGLTERVLKGGVDEVVVLGTAGAVDPGVTRGVHEIGEVFQHDVTDLDGVEGQHVSLPACLSLSRDGLTIATGDSFVGDTARGAQIRAMGAHVLDMEAYVYTWVAQRHDVPIRILKSISDDANEGAETLWDEVVAACSAELWEWFRAEYGSESEK